MPIRQRYRWRVTGHLEAVIGDMKLNEPWREEEIKTLQEIKTRIEAEIEEVNQRINKVRSNK